MTFSVVLQLDGVFREASSQLHSELLIDAQISERYELETSRAQNTLYNWGNDRRRLQAESLTVFYTN